MANYILFKQTVCLIFFFETLVLWPNFYRYFGPQVFPKCVFTTQSRIHAFNILLLAALIFLFLDCYPLIASFILLLCMRYLFVTGSKIRLTTFGAVGFFNYFITAYIFIFEAADTIDPTHQLVNFFHSLLSIEIGVIMLAAGGFKYISGYLQHSGYEYALVNPSWGKFFFIFKKMKPSSWYFIINNYIAFLGEITTAILFFIPQTRMIAAYLLLLLFFNVFLTVRVNILPLLMMSTALLFIQPIPFHFPILERSAGHMMTPESMIILIEAIFIVYLVIYIFITFFRMYLISKGTYPPKFLLRPMQIFFDARPGFDWIVFAAGLTNYFIKIEKASKETKKITGTVYDGFSKHYREIFTDPRLFFRFAHHHESSFLLNIFIQLQFNTVENSQHYQKEFSRRLIMYGKTLLSKEEYGDTILVFTTMRIIKTEDQFIYMPESSFSVDLKSGIVSMCDVPANMAPV